MRPVKLAGTDAEVFAKAHDEDRIVVTSNVSDFLALVQAVDVHAGLILVEDGDLLRDEQERVIRHALATIEHEHLEGRDLLNRALRIDRSGKLEFEDVPAPEAGRLP